MVLSTQDNEDVKFLTATVRCLLGPVLPTLCGDLSGDNCSTHLETVLWTYVRLPAYDGSDTPSRRRFDGRSFADGRVVVGKVICSPLPW